MQSARRKSRSSRQGRAYEHSSLNVVALARSRSRSSRCLATQFPTLHCRDASSGAGGEYSRHFSRWICQTAWNSQRERRRETEKDGERQRKAARRRGNIRADDLKQSPTECCAPGRLLCAHSAECVSCLSLLQSFNQETAALATHLAVIRSPD